MKFTKKGGMFSVVAVAIIAVLMLGVGTLYKHGETVLGSVNMAMISHTEYMSGETGQIVARLVDNQGVPIVATCYATIKYPNKTAFITNQSMTASTISGNFYKTFTTPADEGVYEYQARCYYSPNKHADATNSFHLSPALNTIQQVNATVNNINTAMGGNFTKIYNALQNVNQTTLNAISGLNASMISKLTGINASLSAQIASMNTSILNAIANLNVTVDFTAVLNALSDVNNTINSINGTVNTINTNLLSINSTLTSQLTAIDVKLNGLNATVTNGFATLNSRFNNVDGNLTLILARQTQINNTVNNIWTTLSVTVVNTLNGIVNTQTQINNTVNAINSTTNQILANQQNAVVMTVVSG